MIDIYTALKHFLPKQVRTLLKPFYLRFFLRTFNTKTTVRIKQYDFLIQLDPTNGAVDKYVYMHNNWETRIGNILEQELRAGDTFVDVGANIGYFSLLASKLIGSSGRVFAFEPLPNLVAQIMYNTHLNDLHNIKINQVAAGAERKKLKLSIMPGNIGGSSLVKDIPFGGSEVVDVAPLDEEIAVVSRVDLMKIDVEGYEYEVLVGARKILSTYKPTLILEFSPNVYAKRDSGIARLILVMLREMGYTIRDIDNKVEVFDIDMYLNKLGSEQTNLFAFSNIR